MVDLPEFKATSLDEIPSRVSTARKAFYEHKTRDLEFRLVQLRKLYWAIKDNEEAIMEACAQDLNKPRFETNLGESGWLLNDIVFTTRNLRKWAKDEKASDIDLAFKFMNPKIRKDPLGTVLVIGAFNFPFQLTLGPAIGAIAAGNTVVIKPSENAPRSAAVMQKIIEASVDPSCYTIIQGGIPDVEKIVSCTRSGGVSCNDAALHIPTLPFGGVGESGYGAYRGRSSFDVWVHRRPITSSPSWLESILAIRYPPYAGKISKFNAASALRPDFDRNGKKLSCGWLRCIFTLGGGSAKAGAARATALAAIAYIVLQVLERRSSKL